MNIRSTLLLLVLTSLIRLGQAAHYRCYEDEASKTKKCVLTSAAKNEFIIGQSPSIDLKVNEKKQTHVFEISIITDTKNPEKNSAVVSSRVIDLTKLAKGTQPSVSSILDGEVTCSFCFDAEGEPIARGSLKKHCMYTPQESHLASTAVQRLDADEVRIVVCRINEGLTMTREDAKEKCPKSSLSVAMGATTTNSNSNNFQLGVLKIAECIDKSGKKTSEARVIMNTDRFANLIISICNTNTAFFSDEDITDFDMMYSIVPDGVIQVEMPSTTESQTSQSPNPLPFKPNSIEQLVPLTGLKYFSYLGCEFRKPDESGFEDNNFLMHFKTPVTTPLFREQWSKVNDKTTKETFGDYVKNKPKDQLIKI